MSFPSTIRDTAHLDDLLSEPTPQAIQAVRHAEGDILVLGVAGKMGPTLARMARRAVDAAGTAAKVIGVARFSSPGLEPWLQEHGVETIRCDLLDEAALERLPDCPNVIFMAGRKFGSTGGEPLTWAMNTWLPAAVARRFRSSRIVAFSTGNVYGLVPAGRGGSRETDAPNPVGEYAMSCLGRERMFEYFSRTHGTEVALLRLNYATEMRYGVLADLAARVHARQPIDVTMGYVNVIWQGDANAMALAALAHTASPPAIINIAGADELRVRDLCGRIAARLGVEVTFTGEEAPDALLSNGSRGHALLGAPRVDIDTLIGWTADWVARGGESLGKPTHFESRSGHF
ncbi:MAG TPA: NAD-dependent epimerase/dehydratase family protein [Vicinamibacterales bacterium]